MKESKLAAEEAKEMSKESNETLDIYWKKWKADQDEEAAQVLVEQYIPLVSFHVQRISFGLPKGVSKDDLISLGMEGLYDAIRKFDPSRDLKFDTYASFRIRGAILDGLRKEDWLPRSMREKAKKIDSTVEKLEQKYMRHITAEETAKELGLQEEEVLQVVKESFFANLLSIEEKVENGTTEKGSFDVRDEKTLTPEERLLQGELFTDLVKAIQHLKDKEQLVISLFYEQDLTLTEIGEIMNLSTSRISQIHSKALYKLRNVMSKITN